MMTEPGQSKLEPLGQSWRERLSSLLEFRPREVAALAVLAVAVVAGAGFAFVRSRPKPEPATQPQAVTVVASASPSASPAASLVVHVAGAVLRPGVYTFAAGSRVGDAIAAAGGQAPGADVNSINLARPLTDGERVWIPRKGETPPPDPGGGPGSAGGASGGKVNINTASASELENLPGIGPALAERIVEYRTQHGPFRTVKDLMKVTGIGEKKFAALEDQVTV
jgi:competence protein ComEA